MGVRARSELPAGPRLPRVAQTLRYGLDPYGFFEAAQRAHGDVFTVRVMRETWVVLADPGAVLELYRHGPDELDSGVANASLRPLLGTRNLLLLDGEEHLRRRRIVLPPLHGERLRSYEPLIREATRRELTAWPRDVPARTLPRMQAVTLRVVLQAVFGEAEGPEFERFAASLRRLMAWTTDARRALVFGFLGPDGLARLHGFRRQLAEVDAMLLERIARRRTDRDLERRADTLSLLLQATHEDGTRLTDGELRDELMTLLVAGHETTAAALSWALSEVARDARAQDRIASGEPGLAEAAIAETLRMHPPVPLGSLRRLRQPLTLAAHDLPAGATVATCSLLIHRRPDVYKDPLSWRVDRFLDRRPPAGAWLPFGGAVRRCVGAAFAQFEARIVLDELLRSVRLRPAAAAAARVGRRGIVLVPRGGGPVIATSRPEAVHAGMAPAAHRRADGRSTVATADTSPARTGREIG